MGAAGRAGRQSIEGVDPVWGRTARSGQASTGPSQAFAIVCLSVIWLRRTHPEIPRGFTVPLFPFLPAFGIVACVALIFTVETRVLVFFAWYTLAAVILYFVYGMSHSRLGKGEDQTLAPEMGEFPAPVGEQP